MLVAEGYRLARSHIYIRDERSCVDLISGQYHDGDHEEHSNDADFRQTVRTAMKGLRHVQHTATIGTDRPPAFLNRARIAPCLQDQQNSLHRRAAYLSEARRSD